MERKIDKRKIMTLAVLAVILYLCYQMFSISYELIKVSQVPVLSSNWWQALHWIRDNTPQCAVIATYWDPGHFITGIAERPVVFDGASQNAKRVWEEQGILTREEIRDIVAHDKFEFTYDYERNVTIITTARIQDIAITLFTDNETQAIKILKRYLMPNCNNTMYYIASADLIGKSQWWTYFATWSKETHSGTKYFYYPLSLSRSQLLQEGIAYIYPLSRDASFIVYERNNTLDIYYQAGTKLTKVEHFFYFFNNSGYEKTYSDAELKGMAWLSPDKTWLVYMPRELERALFTRMFLFNGMGLKHFELVGNFGGEVKLYKVKFNDVSGE